MTETNSGPDTSPVTSRPTAPPHQLIKALGAPALALLVTFGAAIVMSVLLIIALALAGDGGSDSEAVSASEDGGLMFFLGLPFQLTAMALFGTLRTSNELFSAGLFAPPLLLTAVFVFATARFSRRAEERAPSATVQQRATAAALGAVFVAAVAMVAARVFAARADEMTFHAASVSLLFGSLFLTFVGAYAGRWIAAGSVWPDWVELDYVVAIRLWAQQVLAWVALSLPVAFVLTLVKANLATAITTPLWGPTGGLYAYALAHLSPASVGGESFFAWEDSWLAALILVAFAIGSALLTSIAWDVRRLQRPVDNTRSWVTLPVVFAVGAVFLWVLSIVSVSGDAFFVSGSVTLQPAVWLVFVLPVWGGAIELLSRTVASNVRSERLRARLASPHPITAGHEARAEAEITTASPDREWTPEQQARARRLLIVGGSVLALAVVGVVAHSIINAKVYGPSGQAAAYLDSVVDADVDTTLELAPLDDSAGHELMKRSVYADAEDRVTGYEITGVEKTGSTAVAKVALQGIEGDSTVELNLERDGRTNGIFDRWKITDGGLASVVSVDVSQASTSSVEVNGQSVDLEDSAADLWALPGNYTFDPYAGSTWVESDPVATNVNPTEFGAYAELPEPQPSTELVTEVERQMNDWLAECMQSDQLDPDDCPQAVYDDQDSVRSLKWSLDEAPEISFDFFDGTFPTDVSVEGGQATATYEFDQSYGFGAPDWQPQSDSSDLSFSASVDADGDTVKATFESY